MKLYLNDLSPSLGSYFGRLVERPSVARVLAEAAPYMPKAGT